MLSPISHVITSEQTETAFTADAEDELPAYSDAVQGPSRNASAWSDDVIEQAASATGETSGDIQACSNEAPDDVSSSSSAVTVVAGSYSSSAMASDVLYRDRYIKYNSRERTRRRKAQEDKDQKRLFTLPRVGSHHEASDLKARSPSSLACENLLKQLSDTYHNRPPARPESSAGSGHGPHSPTTVNPAPERTYRVLLMGSMGPEPVRSLAIERDGGRGSGAAILVCACVCVGGRGGGGVATEGFLLLWELSE